MRRAVEMFVAALDRADRESGVCDLPEAVGLGAWSRDGVIVFGVLGKGLMRVPEVGGAPSIIEVDYTAGERNAETNAVDRASKV